MIHNISNNVVVTSHRVETQAIAVPQKEILDWATSIKIFKDTVLFISLQNICLGYSDMRGCYKKTYLQSFVKVALEILK